MYWNVQEFRSILKKTSVMESLFTKVAGLKASIVVKTEIPTQVFSCEYCKIFKNIFFNRTPYVHLKFYVMIEFFGRLWYKIDIFDIPFVIVLFHFITQNQYSMIIPYLFSY